MADSPKQFIVRFPGDMRDRIAQRAKANGRSMNSEIVDILEQAVVNPTVRDVEALIAESTSVIRGLVEAESRASEYRTRLESIKDELRDIFGEDLEDGDPILHAVELLKQGKLDL